MVALWPRSPLMAHFARPPSGGGSTRQSAAGSRPAGFLYAAPTKGDHGVVSLPVFKCELFACKTYRVVAMLPVLKRCVGVRVVWLHSCM